MVQQVLDGERVLKVVDPVKDGYTFEGWFTDPKFTYKFDFNQPITQDMVIYAKWDGGGYTITYLDGFGNTRTDIVSAGTTDYTVWFNFPATKSGSENYAMFVNENKNLPRWELSNGSLVCLGSVITVTEDITATATWNTISGDFEPDTNTWVLGTGSGEQVIPVEITAQNHKLVNSVKAGYGFNATSLVLPVSIVDIPVDAFKDKTSLKTVYFSSKEAPSIGSNAFPESVEKIYIPAGSDESGYKTALSAYADKIETIDYVQETFTVTFNSDGGTAIPSQSVVKGSVATKPVDPTKQGFAFVGWFKEATCTTEWDFIDDTVTSNTTLYAKWIEVPDYLTFTGSDTITVTPSQYWGDENSTREYSIDGGSTWKTWTSGAVPSSGEGTTTLIMFRGKNCTRGSAKANGTYEHWSITGTNVSVSGNIMTILNYVDIPQSLTEYCFMYMFSNNVSLVNASDLLLSASTLAAHCYHSMFESCSALITPPELTATIMADSCYSCMFEGCTSLSSVPVLSSTTLASFCYNRMFYCCETLTSAPKLPATSFESNCYREMFYGCEGLKIWDDQQPSGEYGEIFTAPNSPSTYCYEMFTGTYGHTETKFGVYTEKFTPLASHKYYWAETEQTYLYLYPEYNTSGVPTSGIASWQEGSTTATRVAASTSAVTWGTAGKTSWYVVVGGTEQDPIKLSDGVTCNGDVNLILTDGCYAWICASTKAGINVSGTNSLTIYGQTNGTGALIAESQSGGCAGIGGNSGSAGKNIVINGGKIISYGSGAGAGIGGGHLGTGSYITINGGIVTASSTGSGAGIGGGAYQPGSYITINGGAVTASCGGASGDGAGIGGGGQGSASYITINGGAVTASGGADGGSGIGRGREWGSYHPTVSNIFVKSTSLVVKAGATTPGTVIQNTGADLASSLDGKRYCTVKEPLPTSLVVNVKKFGTNFGGATVVVKNGDTPVAEPGTTGSDGNCVFTNVLTDTTYSVVASCAASAPYPAFTKTVSVTTGESSTTNLAVELPDRVGGRVYYMHSNNGLTYTFYDNGGDVLGVKQVNGTGTDEIRNTSEDNKWNSVVYYSTEGTKTGDDKFYVYDTTLGTDGLVTGNAWAKKFDVGTGTYGQAGATAPRIDGIGQGKLNTEKCLETPGCFESFGTSSIIDTIWKWLRDEVRADKVGGCNDWFIGTDAELQQLQYYFGWGGPDYQGVWHKPQTGGGFFINNLIWSSVEYGYSYSKYWSYDPSYDSNLWSYAEKTDHLSTGGIMAFGVVALRSF